MKAHARVQLAVSLLGAVLIAASCAEMREKQVREVVTRYLEYELKQDYRHQAEMYDYKSSISLPALTYKIRNPFEPRILVQYAIKQIAIEGGTARAEIEAVFEMVWPGGFTNTENPRTLTVYLVHEADGWKVDEIRTRTEALDAIQGPGAGQMWLTSRKNAMQPGPF